MELREWFRSTATSKSTGTTRLLYGAALALLVVGILLYLVFVPVFASFNLPAMVGLNLLIVAWLALGIRYFRSTGKLTHSILFSTTAVVAHGTIATLLLGPGPGFMYEVLLALYMQTLAVQYALRWRVLASSALACLFAYLVLSTEQTAIYELSAWQERAFLLFNLSSLLFISVALGLSFGVSIDRSWLERDAAEQATQRLLEESRALLDNMAEGLVSFDNWGKLRTLNSSLLKILEVSSDISRSDLPAPLLDLAEDVRRTGRLSSCEFESSRGRMLSAVATPVQKLGGTVVLVRDVTHEREVDRMKTQLVSVVSHELRTPLTSVLGFAHLVSQKMSQRVLPHTNIEDPRVARAVEQIQRNLQIILVEGERLSKLIHDVLDISKIEAGHMPLDFVSVDFRDLAERARVVAAPSLKPGVELMLDVDDHVPNVRGDPDRLQQVILNLLSNASKFTTRGNIRLVVREDTDERVRVEVVDTGIGFESSRAEEVFDRFTQVHDAVAFNPGGTGLGLAICRHIVEQHGGTIKAASKPGVGTTMTFWLPSDPVDVEPVAQTRSAG